jgi:ABC-2 type transport system permease protein
MPDATMQDAHPIRPAETTRVEGFRGLLLLLRKGLRYVYNYRFVVMDQSLFKVVFSTLFMTVTLACLFGVFYAGFEFLDQIGGVGVMIINRLFALFFFGLGILLILSSTITSYTTYYQSPEMPYLLLRPLHLRDVLTYKYGQTVLMSSWAFFFIILPFVGAYAAYESLSIWFTVWTLLYSVPFALLCCALGTLITFVMVRYLPRGKPLALLVTAFLAGMGLAVLGAVQGVLRDTGTDQMLLLSRLVPGFQLTSHPIWPSYWVAEGMMTMSRGQWGRGMLFLALLSSWVLVLGMAIRAAGVRLFYDGWQQVLSAGSRTSRKPVMLRSLDTLLRWVLPTDFRALLMKDLRVFLRDPAQWSQGLIFYGILGLYFVNLRNLQYHTLSEQWRNIIAFLNVFSVAAVMCSVGARFIYPQLSLEGQGFWIVGMSPVTMGRVLLAKFAAALVVLGSVSVVLMAVSVRMLGVDPGVQTAALAIAVCMSIAVAGMAIGFGAVFIDLKQRNPAAIISSFGGTLNLVLTLGFMFAAILPFAALYHLHIGGRLPTHAHQIAVNAAYGYLAVITATAASIPLLLGRHSLRIREF